MGHSDRGGEGVGSGVPRWGSSLRSATYRLVTLASAHPLYLSLHLCEMGTIMVLLRAILRTKWPILYEASRTVPDTQHILSKYYFITLIPIFGRNELRDEITHLRLAAPKAFAAPLVHRVTLVFLK